MVEVGDGGGCIFSSGNVLSVWLQLWTCSVDGWGQKVGVTLGCSLLSFRHVGRLSRSRQLLRLSNPRVLGS